MVNIDDIEQRLSDLEQRVERLENTEQKKPDSIFEFTESIIKNIDKIPTRELVILLLKNTPSQSIKEIEKNLLNIGWVKDTFFTKNFATMLVSKGLVQPSGKDTRGKNSYSLTAKGKMYAEDILKKFDKKFQ